MDGPAKPAYTASQWAAPGSVDIQAKGKERTSGYAHRLVQLPVDANPPRFRFERIAPKGATRDVVTPYEVTASFFAPGLVTGKIRIEDAWGGEDVPVTLPAGRP